MISVRSTTDIPADKLFRTVRGEPSEEERLAAVPAPDQQRLVFIRQPGRLLPFLGLVITWPITGTGGRFLVAFWDDSSVQPGVRMAWLRRHQLVPILADPNWIDGPAP